MFLISTSFLVRFENGCSLSSLHHVESVHDGPNPADDSTVELAEAHSEGNAEELLLVAAGGGGEHGSGTGHEDVGDQAENGAHLSKLNHGFLALHAANITATFVTHLVFQKRFLFL